MGMLGDKFKEIRGRRSVEQIADEFGLSRQTWHRIESGVLYPSEKIMKEIAKKWYASYPELVAMKAIDTGTLTLPVYKTVTKAHMSEVVAFVHRFGE